MAEENKPPMGLNLGRRVEDQNSQPKPNNEEQTRRVDAPNTNDDAMSGRAGLDPTSEAATGRSVEETEDEGDSEFRAAADELAAQSAVDAAGVAAAEGETTIYSSHPIMNYAIGPFRFENSVLRLPNDSVIGIPREEQVSKFEEILKRLPAAERGNVRKLDMDRVDAIVQARRQATQQFDSSLGREALNQLHGANPTVGTEELGFENRPQMDNNVPVIPAAPVDDEGETGLDQGSHRPPEGSGAREGS